MLNSAAFEKVLDQWEIIGAGGKDGPTEDPDTLRSEASASALAVFSEGEIQGFPAGISIDERNKRIFLDDTPFVNFVTSESMFDDSVGIEFKNGSQGQSSIRGFDDVKIEQSIGLQVKKSIGPISATTTNSYLNQLVVRVGVASLFKIDDEGNVKGTVVDFTIQIKNGAGTLVNEGNSEFSIEGKTRGAYDREYSFVLSAEEGPWTVTVERITDDIASVRFNSDFYFRAIIGIINETLRYPNSALVGVTVSAENFQSVPKISALLQGIKIQVPNNYSSASNSYSGVWQGNFKVEYNNNPVWVFYDLLTNTRYGAGLFIEQADIDIYALLPIAKYCDEMVPDGKGGTEKRFTFNAYINNRAEAFEVLNALAASFRGMLYYAQGQITATQDTPKSPKKIFSSSNVVSEIDDNGEVTSPPFVYEGTARKARKTVALVSWNDPADRYKAKVEYVEDRDAIERYGYREIDIRGFGCTSQGQAQRLGKWTLLSDLNETETVTFKTGAEGFFIFPGEIIEVADPNKNTGLLAGISPELGGDIVVLDRAVNLAPDISYQLILGTDNGNSIRRSVTTEAGRHTSLTVSPSLPEGLEAPAPWILRESTASPRPYRVVALTEEEGIVTVLAVAYYEEKFDLVDTSARIDEQRTSVPRLNIVPVVSAGSIQLQVR